MKAQEFRERQRKGLNSLLRRCGPPPASVPHKHLPGMKAAIFNAFANEFRSLMGIGRWWAFGAAIQ